MAELLDQGVETPAGDVPIIPVTLMVAGAYLAWFGVHYWGSDTKWPTDPLKALLQGKAIPTPDRTARTDALQGLANAWSTNAASAVGSGAAAVANQVGSQLPGPGSPTGATTLDHSQLEALWTSNGGNPAVANVAAATAEAESSGRTWITSPNPDGGTNVGLYQLDTKGEGAGYTVAQLQDPATNTRITILKSSNGTNWSHWSSHPDAYKKYLA
jgi:hypothetical protein